jgi:hypothetical protein
MEKDVKKLMIISWKIKNSNPKEAKKFMNKLKIISDLMHRPSSSKRDQKKKTLLNI